MLDDTAYFSVKIVAVQHQDIAASEAANLDIGPQTDDLEAF
jgi:hypothetical protein